MYVKYEFVFQTGIMHSLTIRYINVILLRINPFLNNPSHKQCVAPCCHAEILHGHRKMRFWSSRGLVHMISKVMEWSRCKVGHRDQRSKLTVFVVLRSALFVFVVFSALTSTAAFQIGYTRRTLSANREKYRFTNFKDLVFQKSISPHLRKSLCKKN